jgi:hypothetical protein
MMLTYQHRIISASLHLVVGLYLKAETTHIKEVCVRN